MLDSITAVIMQTAPTPREGLSVTVQQDLLEMASVLVSTLHASYHLVQPLWHIHFVLPRTLPCMTHMWVDRIHVLFQGGLAGMHLMKVM